MTTPSRALTRLPGLRRSARAGEFTTICALLVNIRFLAMTNHYVFTPEFCNPSAGSEKGQVEKNVQDAGHGFGNRYRSSRTCCL
ncbi:hypothetical protein BN77_p2140060 [Rhizobium mesoamericanum STM3625]|uniref:Transposase n=1 Tax=Rhizobium mesoamericanum STM3625 TaxID=1211777 RepID=K0Q0T9_9HYPH|nr:hypothetical protein BN77_p2140060 [Rhizobium mesoamericanum STM3625]